MKHKRGDLETAKDALEGADEGKGNVRDVDNSNSKDAAHAVDAGNALVGLGLGEGVREQVRLVHVAARAVHSPCAGRDSKKERRAENDRNKERDVLLDGQLLHAVEEDCLREGEKTIGVAGRETRDTERARKRTNKKWGKSTNTKGQGQSQDRCQRTWRGQQSRTRAAGFER